MALLPSIINRMMLNWTALTREQLSDYPRTTRHMLLAPLSPRPSMEASTFSTTKASGTQIFSTSTIFKVPMEAQDEVSFATPPILSMMDRLLGHRGWTNTRSNSLYFNSPMSDHQGGYAFQDTCHSTSKLLDDSQWLAILWGRSSSYHSYLSNIPWT